MASEPITEAEIVALQGKVRELTQDIIELYTGARPVDNMDVLGSITEFQTVLRLLEKAVGRVSGDDFITNLVKRTSDKAGMR